VILRILDTRTASPISCSKGHSARAAGGEVVGPLGGSIISLPAFFNHEWLSMPVAAAAGLVGG